MPRVILALASIAIAVYALADCATTPQERVRGLPKLVWVLLIVLIPWVGPLAWLLVGKDRSAGGPVGVLSEVQGYLAQGSARRARRRPIAPDEDPEFLAKLDHELRAKRRRERDAAKNHEGPEPGSEDQPDPDDEPDSEAQPGTESGPAPRG